MAFNFSSLVKRPTYSIINFFFNTFSFDPSFKSVSINGNLKNLYFFTHFLYYNSHSNYVHAKQMK